MDCNCIENANNQMRTKLGDPEGSIDSRYTVFESKMKPIFVIPFIYRRKNKEGKFLVIKGVANLTVTYSPFCGKKKV